MQSSAQLKKFIDEEEGNGGENEPTDMTGEGSMATKRKEKPLNDLQKKECNDMIITALKAFGGSKPMKPEKGGKRGATNDSKSKKKSPPPPKKSKDRTTPKGKTTPKTLTMLSSQRQSERELA
jgi:hypothetical protein